ncbi:MAG: DUF2283 domain-containing protein [Desulfobacteraceae bacterium]|nr:MAG: DUF2283 domain-containing protein [Desulfobacteraceae bacterium]
MEKDLKGIKLRIKYDKESDILYVSFGNPRPGISREVREGDLVRFDPYTDEVVGITILDFKAKYMSSSQLTLCQSAKNVVPIILGQIPRYQGKERQPQLS